VCDTFSKFDTEKRERLSVCKSREYIERSEEVEEKGMMDREKRRIPS